MEMIQFDEHIFQRGWRKATKLDFSMSKVEGKVEGAIAEGVSHFLKHSPPCLAGSDDQPHDVVRVKIYPHDKGLPY